MLEEVIKQERKMSDTPKKPAKREEPLDSQGEETATSDADELTTYEKGIQQKFNSVSSISSSDSLNVVTTTVRNMDQPVNDVVHDTSGVSEKVEKISLKEQSQKSTERIEESPENEQEKNDENTETDKTEEKTEKEAENGELKENEPIGTDVKVNVIGDGVIELKRIDGSVRQSSNIYNLTLNKGILGESVRMRIFFQNLNFSKVVLFLGVKIKIVKNHQPWTLRNKSLPIRRSW